MLYLEWFLLVRFGSVVAHPDVDVEVLGSSPGQKTTLKRHESPAHALYN